MNGEDIKRSITINQVYDLLYELKASPELKGDKIEAITVCHGGDKHKLFYYDSDKKFFCYTQCGSFDIFKLIQNVKNLSDRDAYSYVCNKFKISNFKRGFDNDGIDWKWVNKFNIDNSPKNFYKTYSKKILNYFYDDMFHHSFIEDGITIDTMKKFGIRFDVLENRIIIPCLDIHGEIMAVRCRNLEESLVDSGKKYMPIIFNDEVLKAPTSLCLYGIYQNQHNIRKNKKVIIAEGEKAILQLQSILNENIGVAIQGSSLSEYHIITLLELGAEEFILALDKEFKTPEEEQEYKIKIEKKFLSKIYKYSNVSVIWYNDKVKFKENAMDSGKENFMELYNNRIIYREE